MWRAKLVSDDLFHVKHSFAETEATEQQVQDILGSCSPRELVEGRTRGSQILRNQFNNGGRPGAGQARPCGSQMRRLPAIQRNRVLCRKEVTSDCRDALEQGLNPLAGDRGYGEKAFRRSLSARLIASRI